LVEYCDEINKLLTIRGLELFLPFAWFF